MRRGKILIVDGDKPFVSELTQALYGDNAEYDVLVAFSAEVAEAIMSETPIDVLVTDVHPPTRRRRVDWLPRATSLSPATRVIATTTSKTPHSDDKAFRLGCLDLVQKPFESDRLRGPIRQALRFQDSLSGNLGLLDATDVVQMLCLNRRTIALRISSGENFGVLHIVDGEIVHASTNDVRGTDAVYQILRQKKGAFHTRPLPTVAGRTVDLPWQYLLMEAMRLADEHQMPREPSTDSPFGSAPIELGLRRLSHSHDA
ncbi:MAG: DUF4388 domain-containing protein [Deltaproteobacteria bacterium]|nr:DUF4388 domain-containing protein [Deltaproteobacteria bacterium]